MANPKTPGDELFEAYLRQQGGYEFEFEPDLAAEFGIEAGATPDYLVRWSGNIAICEVKHFTGTTIRDRMMTMQTFTTSQKEEFGPVRNAIRKGARRLGPYRDAGVPLVLVLTNPLNADANLSPYGITHSVLGEDQVTIPVDRETGGPAGPPEPTIGRDGGSTRSPGRS